MQKRNNSHFEKSLFITFEGVEGAGKSTLLQSLYESFIHKKIPCVQTHEPGGTLLGKHLREILLHREPNAMGKKAEILLFLADRANHVEQVILPALRQGSIVLCDRFNDSTIAYQSDIGIDDSKLRDLCDFATNNLQPNITFLLDIDPLLSLRRLRTRDHFENKELAFHKGIRKKFLELASNEKKRFVILDATLPKDQIFQVALSRIQEAIQYV